VSRTAVTTNDRPLLDERRYEVWRLPAHRRSPDRLLLIARLTAGVVMVTIVLIIGPLLRLAGGE
jgi:hypothetical protein